MRGSLILGLALTGLALLAAGLSFLWTPGDVTQLAIADKLQPPSGRHWLGLRLHGRDGSVEDWAEQPIDLRAPK